MHAVVKSSDAFIPASALKIFSEYVDRLGGNASAYCESSGIGLTQYEDDDYVSLSAYVNLLEYSAEQLNMPYLGFNVSTLQKLDDFGPIVPLIRSAETLRQALNYLAIYQPVHVPMMSYSLVEAPGGTTELCWTMQLPNQSHNQFRQAMELGLGIVLRLIRDLLSPDFTPSYVRVAANDPEIQPDTFRASLGCDVLYGQPITSIAIPAAKLSTRLKTKDKFLVELMRNHLERARANVDVPLEKRVELMISAQLCFGSCTLKVCAQQLSLAPRTLQSRLAELGLDFSVLLERQRRFLAEGYLRDSQLPLIEIANILGYSDQATFSRAFKAWTGESPSYFRDAARVSRMAAQYY